MSYHEHEIPLTRKEKSLGELVTAEEWRERYQPNGNYFRNHPLPKPKAKITARPEGDEE